MKYYTDICDVEVGQVFYPDNKTAKYALYNTDDAVRVSNKSPVVGYVCNESVLIISGYQPSFGYRVLVMSASGKVGWITLKDHAWCRL